MRRITIASIAALGLALGGTLAAQQASDRNALRPVSQAGLFEVSGIDVDVSGRTAEQARAGGWRQAQRLGWRMLWARTTGRSAESAPNLGDSALDAMVSGIIVEREQNGPNRYIARLGVTFDRARAGSLLGVHGRMLRSPPELMIPVEITGATRTAYESQTGWARAWARFRAGMSPVDYVRPSGTGTDPLLLTAAQMKRGDRDWWRAILDQYGAADVLIAEAYLDYSWPGGPVRGRFVARHGPDGAALATFELRANSNTGLDAMLDEAVRRIDAIYGGALRSGRLRADPSLLFEDNVVTDISPDLTLVDRPPAIATIDAQVETPDAATLTAIESAVRDASGVSSQSIMALSLGGTSTLRIAYDGNFALLRWALDQRGWRLDGGLGGHRIRRRAAGEAALPKPETPPPPSPSAPTPAVAGPVPATPPPVPAR